MTFTSWDNETVFCILKNFNQVWILDDVRLFFVALELTCGFIVCQLDEPTILRNRSAHFILRVTPSFCTLKLIGVFVSEVDCDPEREGVWLGSIESFICWCEETCIFVDRADVILRLCFEGQIIIVIYDDTLRQGKDDLASVAWLYDPCVEGLNIDLLFQFRCFTFVCHFPPFFDCVSLVL